MYNCYNIFIRKILSKMSGQKNVCEPLQFAPTLCLRIVSKQSTKMALINSNRDGDICFERWFRELVWRYYFGWTKTVLAM